MRALLRLGLLAGLLVAFGASVRPVSADSPIVADEGMPRGAPKAFDFKIGAITLRLSPALIGQLGAVSNNKGAYLFLQFLLPDFETRNSKNESEFTEPGWHRQISIYLEFPSKRRPLKDFIYGIDGLLSELNGPPNDKDNKPYDREVTSDLPGFREYRTLLHGDVYVNQDSTLYFSCPNTYAHSYPYCQTTRKIWNNVNLDYSFSRNFIQSAASIDQHVESLLQSLVVKSVFLGRRERYTSPGGVADANQLSPFREYCNEITGVTRGPVRSNTPTSVSAKEAGIGVAANFAIIGPCLAAR